MPHVHDILRERLHKRAGLTEPAKAKFNLLALEVSEWSPQFEKLMRNRLIMGALRYGTLAEKKVKGKKWDLVEPIRKKIELYEQTGNTEYLVDAANYCMLTFECDNHPNKHFKALDDHHDHCKPRRTTVRGFDQNGKAISEIFNGAKPYRESDRSLARVMDSVSFKNPCKPTRAALVAAPGKRNTTTA